MDYCVIYIFSRYNNKIFGIDIPLYGWERVGQKFAWSFFVEKINKSKYVTLVDTIFVPFNFQYYNVLTHNNQYVLDGPLLLDIYSRFWLFYFAKTVYLETSIFYLGLAVIIRPAQVSLEYSIKTNLVYIHNFYTGTLN